MNRQIWGIALFLIIVKSTFLLYWGFFAPNNFYVTETYLPTPVETVETKKTCKLPAKSVNPKLQSVVINTKNGEITETLHIEQPNVKLPETHLHIFDEDGRMLWTSGDSKGNFKGTIDFDMDTMTLNFKALSPKLVGLKSNENYYAQLEISPKFDPRNDDCDLDVVNATPVLLNSGK